MKQTKQILAFILAVLIMACTLPIISASTESIGDDGFLSATNDEAFPTSDEADSTADETTIDEEPIRFMVGDVNEDGRVNIKDTTNIQKAIVRLVNLSNIAQFAADVDKNGSINIKDATTIALYASGNDREELNVGSYVSALHENLPAMLEVKAPAISEENLSKTGINVADTIYKANVDDIVTYTVKLIAKEIVEDIHVTVTYDSQKLELVRTYNNDREDLNVENISNPIFNTDVDGYISFCSFDIFDGFDYTNGAELITLSFMVKDTAYSEIDLIIEEMTISGGENSYFANGQSVVTEGITLTESLTVPETDEDVIITGTTGDGFEYEIDNKEVTITGYTGLASSIIIPNEIEGYPVTSIGNAAFFECTDIIIVTIPEGVTKIGGSAFSGCTALNNVTLPDSVTSIGNYAFRDCNSLADIVIPNGVSKIGEAAFMECTSLKSIKIPESVISIGTYPFEGCSGLIRIIVDENNSVYDSRSNCNAIIQTATNTLIQGCQTTIIPSSVTSIDYGAFHDCKTLTSIVIPDSVTSISDLVFYGCTSLKNVKLSNSVTQLIWYMFSGCTALEYIVIPECVTTIDYGVFSDCINLTDVYYKGDAEQWNAIKIYGNNEYLLNANIHFNATLPDVAIAFSCASLTLQDNLCINFKVNETLFTEVGYENPYVVFELNGEEYTVSDYEVVSGKYVFDFSDISPANMNDTVKATLYATFDGVEYASETREYSVATYCYNMLSKYNTDDYAELRTLLVDLLNYGAQTQIYTNHNINTLVNANLTAEQAAWGTSEAPVYETVQNLAYKTIDNPTVSWKGGGLNLEDSVTMRFKISAESIENLTVKAENEESIWTIPAEEFEATAGDYYVFFDGLDASQMSEPVYLTVYDGDTPVSNTICYSVESYAYSKQSSTDTNLVNLLEAMMKYGNSASAYVN